MNIQWIHFSARGDARGLLLLIDAIYEEVLACQWNRFRGILDCSIK